MKKTIICALALTAMVSCGKTYTAKDVTLDNANDSVNYALGLVNGAQLKMQLQGDTTEADIAEFIDALQRGYDGKIQDLTEVESVGRNIGQAIKASEKKGLAENPAWALNEKIMLQGLVNACKGDTTMMQAEEARTFFQNQYMASQMLPKPEEVEKAVTAKCGKTAKTIELKTLNDSLNYAFGVLNGNDVHMYILANDSDGVEFEDFVKALNNGLKSKVNNPQMVTMGENIGKQIKEQEETGLVGVMGLDTDFELIKQGFVNGLHSYLAPFESTMDAGTFIDKVINEKRYGNTKETGEIFLEENAHREGVIVTESGLQYEVLTMGKGRKPSATDRVKVHYHGTLIDGTVFDSSVQRGEPITFALNQVIPGWTEGVQLMPVGSKFKFYIPQELGYGDRSAGSIPPYSALIFEVELLDIE